MINIAYTKKNNSFVLEFQGHANYNPGNDIVCSAVSVLCYTLAGAVSNIPPECVYTEKRLGSGCAYVKVNIKNKEIREKVNIIFETVLIGLLQLEESYPDHIFIKTVNYSD